MKRFLLKSLLYSTPIIVPIIYFTIFINPHLSGDIGPLGYVSFPKEYANGISLNDNVVNCGYNIPDCQKYDILTIGDSFSQSTYSNSYNSFLADYVTSNVFNHNPNWGINPFNRFILLSKMKTLPRLIIIESAERYLIDRLIKINFDLTSEDMIAYNIVDTTAFELPRKKSILAKTQEWTKRILGIYENPIHHCVLSKSYFTCSNKENDLYFYVDDITHINTSQNNLDNAILKLDSLFSYANTLDIDLYVLIAADKYDIYQDYIINNQYPKADVLERLTEKYAHPNLINSKDTLSKMVADGIKDIYWCNDTHWSPIGSEAVAKQVLEIINCQTN